MVVALSNGMAAEPTEPLEEVLGSSLLAARLVAGLSQHDLAAASRISRATIAQIESGSSDPRLSTIRALAEALKVSPPMLLSGALRKGGRSAVVSSADGVGATQPPGSPAST